MCYYSGPATEWYDALSIHLRYSKTVRSWFAQNVLFTHPQRFAEYLLECPNSEVSPKFPTSDLLATYRDHPMFHQSPLY